MTNTAIKVRGFYPVYAGDFELSRPDPGPIAEGSGAAFTVRLHGVPLGMLILDPGRAHAGADAITAAAVTLFADAIRQHLFADGLADVELPGALTAPITCRVQLHPVEPPPTVSVVICTLGTDEQLPAAMRSLLDQDYPRDRYEILLVDNDPGSGPARAVLDSLDDADSDRIRYVSQPVRGIPNARNAGIAAASCDVVAFVDDDVIADPGWLRAIAATITESPLIDAVTGLVLPASLQTQAEQLFEVACGFDKGYARQVWTTDRTSQAIRELGPVGNGGPLFPFSVGRFGTGANMAFRAESLRRIGGFDPVMTNSEDIDILFRIIFGGGVVVYEPQALVRHHHGDKASATARQMHNYGVGFSAFLTKQFLHTPGAARRILALTPAGLLTMIRGRRNQVWTVDPTPTGQSLPVTLPRNLGVAEARGLVRGPAKYLSTRHRHNRARRN